MTVKDLIKELQVLSYGMPNGVSTDICVEIGTAAGETERYTPECYFDEDEDCIVVSY